MKNRIRDLREDADLTQKQVAQYLQMSQTGYSKYETGENDIPTVICSYYSGFVIYGKIWIYIKKTLQITCTARR